MYFVYAISSIKHNYIYVGLTNNLIRRFHEHNSGKEKTTGYYGPFILIHSEAHQTRIQARTREKYLKSGCGKKISESH